LPPDAAKAGAGSTTAPPATGRTESAALPREGMKGLVAQLLRFWGVNEDLSSAATAAWPTGPDGNLDLLELMGRYQLAVTLLADTTLPELRAIGLPALLDLEERGARRPFLLRRLTDDTAILLTPAGDELRFALGAVEVAWTRSALVVWRNVDLVPSDPQQELTPIVLATLALRLQKLGHLTPPLPAVNGERFQQGVRRFQRTMGLTEDGIVGPRTTLALSRVVGGRFVPTIADPSLR
jgi:hypothetical protein